MQARCDGSSGTRWRAALGVIVQAPADGLALGVQRAGVVPARCDGRKRARWWAALAVSVVAPADGLALGVQRAGAVPVRCDGRKGEIGRVHV